MRRLRMIHLYLGCVLAPMLIFFCVSGAWQTYRLQDDRKDGTYHAPRVLKALSGLHTHQRPPGGTPSRSLQAFVVLAASAVAVSSILGLVMALKVVPVSRVWLCLAAGVVLPLLFLALG